LKITKSSSISVMLKPKTLSKYKIEIQNKFIPAMCVLHNYIQWLAPEPDFLDEWDLVEDGLVDMDEGRPAISLIPSGEISQEELGFHISREEKERAEACRDRIA
ncbi:hypothetical protein Moror_6237, partial [Moniliophthora roreri MCA 2997]